MGASGLDRELRDVGFDVVGAAQVAERMAKEGLDGWAAAGHPDAVIGGLDPQLTYLRIAAAADCIRAGARFIATNRDPVYPTERGLRPGAGSVIAAIEVASGVTPLVIGKPGPAPPEEAASAVNAEARGRDRHRRRRGNRHRGGARGRGPKHSHAHRGLVTRGG